MFQCLMASGWNWEGLGVRPYGKKMSVGVGLEFENTPPFPACFLPPACSLSCELLATPVVCLLFAIMDTGPPWDHTPSHIYTLTHTHPHSHTLHLHTRTFTHTLTHTHIPTLAHSQTHILTQFFLFSLSLYLSLSLTHTHTHTYTHTHTHTHTHTRGGRGTERDTERSTLTPPPLTILFPDACVTFTLKPSNLCPSLSLPV